MSKSLLELTPVQAVACCSPLTKEPLSAEGAERIAAPAQGAGRPGPPAAALAGGLVRRRRGLCLRLNDAFDLAQPTISHHLKVLHDVGLLDRSKRGVWVYYGIRSEPLADVGALLGAVSR